MGKNQRRIGNEKEILAAHFLQQKGFILLEQNFACRSGEIDLILQEGPYLVFTEVKYRANAANGFPQEAVDWRKQRKILQTAKYYLLQNRLPEQTPCRFDVVAILGEEITLIRNAFEV